MKDFTLLRSTRYCCRVCWHWLVTSGKKIKAKPGLLVLSLLLFLMAAGPARAQVDIPLTDEIKANFGVEADVYANVNEIIDNALYDGTDDWFQDLDQWPGSGEGVIDVSSAAAMSLISQWEVDEDDNIGGELRQSIPIYTTTLDGRIWIDAVYGRDQRTNGNLSDMSFFTAGDDKNFQDPETWTIGTGSGGPQKNDIIEFVGHLRRDNDGTINTLGTEYAIFGATTRSQNGTSHLDFELFRAPVELIGGNLVSEGTECNRTAYEFAANGSVITHGDVIFSVNYENGGDNVKVELYIWIDRTDFPNVSAFQAFNALSSNPFDFGSASGDFNFYECNTDPNYGYAQVSLVSALSEDWVTAQINQAPVTGPPWGTYNSKGDLVDDFPTLAFIEISLDATALGLDTGTTSGSCQNPLGSVIVKTRSSASFTAELKDLSGPYQLGDTPEVDVTLADQALNCTLEFVTLQADVLQEGTYKYEWFIKDGEDFVKLEGIPEDQDELQVSEPGIYKVRVTRIFGDGSEGCFDEDEATVTGTNDAPELVTTCPEADTVSCTEDINSAFTTWLNTFDVTGGGGTVTSTYTVIIDGGAESAPIDFVNWPQGITEPDDVCGGGSVQVNLSASDECTQSDSCSSTFTLEPITPGLNLPPNGSDTVSCPEDASDPGAPATIQDACGNDVVPELIGSSTPVECEGEVLWTYKYTECDGTVSNWTFTYTIDYSGGLSAPDDDSDLVSCPEDAIDPGAPADILDACGRTVSAVLVGQDDPTPDCEGQVVWRYRYTACDGETTDDWTFTYTIDYSGGLSAPDDDSDLVSCPEDATDPGAPADILDACGRTVSAVLVGQDDPTPDCEGQVVWRYRYTACDGETTDDWTFTYTIDYSGGLSAPDDDSDLVSCPEDATDPGAPADILDACGRTVSAVLVGQDDPTPDCEGQVVWRYRYTACDGETTDDWTFTYTIDYSGGLSAPDDDSDLVSCPEDATDPGAPADILDACGRTVSAVLVGQDDPTPDCEGQVVWRYRYTACDGETTDDWTFTYTIDYSGGLSAPDDDSDLVSCPEDATNPGAPADILDACGRTVSAVLVGQDDPTPDCEGQVVWRYRYTACDGETTDDWTFTYTIDYSGGLSAPDDDSDLVSCPEDAIDPGAPADILDACGRTVSAVLVGQDDPTPDCEGQVVWRYRYTACDGETTDDWTFTYTIDYSGGLSAPDDDSDLVSCPEDAIDPGAPADILDACGRTVSAVLVGQDDPTPDCEGQVVWRYRYTACDGETTDDWTFTYTIDYSGGLSAPDDDSDLVSCPEDATDPGAPADILDACGRTVSAVLVGQDDPTPDCEGQVVWRYRYTACDGETTDDWTFTYTIDYSGGLSAPDDDSDLVSCPEDAIDPGAPADILDACGRTVSAVLVGQDDPTPDCEGQVVWRYRYTACDGETTDDWTFTYTIDYSGGLSAPDDDSDLVSCPEDAIDPGAPADILDACGRTVSAVLVGQDDPTPDCEGQVVWRYRYTACDGETTDDWTFTYTIDYSGGLSAPDDDSDLVSCPEDATDPGAPADILDACGRTVSAVLVGQDDPTPDCEGQVVWRYRYTACDGETTDDWTFTYTIDYSGGLSAPDDDSDLVSCPEDATDPGAPADILDACGRTVSAVLVGQDDPTPDCEGQVVWRYRYTACDGETTDDWTFTYTIDYSGGLSAPDDDSDLVSCPEDAIDPGAPADILDACGRTVSAVLVGQDDPTPDCEGQVVWRYRYTACDGETTDDWTFTYTIDYSGGLSAPDDDSDLVSCPEDAIDPGAPADILDACGRTVSAVLVGQDDPTPDCEGQVVWRYRYTACDGETTDDWTFTYTIDYSGGLSAPDDDSDLVSCPEDATNPGAPADILDACGRTVSAVLIGQDDPTPDCEGQVVWRYRYTACDGETTDDWTFTYTIDYSGGLSAPDDDSDLVSCPEDATNPGAPADILDACGRTVSAVLIGQDDPTPDCEGQVVWRYRYTACDGETTDDWTFTYTIDYSGGLSAPDDDSDLVSCPEDATDPGAPADILDACGRTVSAVLVGQDDPTPDCEGQVVWRYRYTACDGETTDDWTFTYTIDYSGGLTAPDDNELDVQCPEDVVMPDAPGIITDACGRIVEPVFTGRQGNPEEITCKGTVIYTWTYTACDGETTDTYTYTYNIEDTIDPVIEVPEVDNVCEDEVPESLSASWTDNCADGEENILAFPVLVGEDECSNTYRYTWTVNDGCGNTDTASVEIVQEFDVVGECETIFGYANDDISQCFLEDDFNRWGWTNNLTSEDEYVLTLYAGAGQCDRNKGAEAGTAIINYENDEVTVTYQMNGYTLTEAHVYIGCTPYPIKNGRETVAPGQYNFNPSFSGSVQSYQVGPIDVSDLDDVYVIVHGVACEIVCQCTPDPNGEIPSAFDGASATCDESQTASNGNGNGNGKNNKTAESSFSASPVPFNDKLTLKYDFEYTSNKVDIQVYDLSGRLLRTYSDKKVKGGDTKELNIDFALKANQVYIIRMVTDREVLTKNVISSSRK